MSQRPLRIVRSPEPAAAEAGPPRSFDAFFALESETLFRRMWLVTRDKHEAEEVVQDAFLSVFERWDRVSNLPDPTGYLYRTAFNAWKKRLRRHVLSRKRSTPEPAEGDPFAAADARLVVDQALDQLTPRQRAAIVLTELLGHSSEEAGEVMGVRPVTARVLASQARGAMREWLERESERVELPAGMADRMYDRGRRRARNRRAAAFGIGTLLFLAVVAIIRAAIPDREPKPAIPTPTSPAAVAGAYSLRLSNANAAVRRFEAAGRYRIRLTEDGRMVLSGPRSFDLAGDPMTFDVERGRLTTDALVGSRCNADGTYSVSFADGILTLRPIEESCELRRVLLASTPWALQAHEAPRDPLEGERTSAYSCERMVRAVRRASVEPQLEGYWIRSTVLQRRSDDPDDPCAGSDAPGGSTFRFEDGRLLIFDRGLDGDLPEGFDGSYEIDGNTITLADGSSDNILGRYRVAFRIEGDRVTFDLLGRAGGDPFFVATWESARFVRSA